MPMGAATPSPLPLRKKWTGSCAAAVCAAVAGFTRRNVQVRLALGSLAIRWAEDGNIYMAGPAAYSFTGSIA